MSRRNNKTLGIDLSGIFKSLNYFGLVARRVFSFAILDISDISSTIYGLKRRGRRFVSIYASISPKTLYFINGKEKSFDTAAAILYDFVDGFVISAFEDDIASAADPIINLRLINDEYRDIFVEIPSGTSSEQLDKILEFVRYSDIDGLLLDDETLFRTCCSNEAYSAFRLMVNNVSGAAMHDSLVEAGAEAVFVKAKSKVSLFYVIRGLLIRFKSKMKR